MKLGIHRASSETTRGKAVNGYCLFIELFGAVIEIWVMA